MAAGVDELRAAIERCVAGTTPGLEQCLPKPGAIQPSVAAAQPSSLAPSTLPASEENEALQVRLRAAEHEAETLRRQLHRTQSLCASALFDLRSRHALRACFYALVRQPVEALMESYATPQPPGAHGTPGKKRGASSAAPSSALRSTDDGDWWTAPSIGGEDDWWSAGGGEYGLEPMSLRPSSTAASTRNGDSAPRGGGRAVGSLRHAGVWVAERADELSQLRERAEALGGGLLSASSSASRLRSSRQKSHGGGIYSSPDSPASPTQLDLLEAEERHDAQIASFMHALRASKQRLSSAFLRERTRHMLRLCLHALRAFANEQLAWRGSKHGVMVADKVSGRLLVGAVFVAWRLAASSATAKREQTRAVVAVVSERLVEAEGHFEALVSDQVRLRLQTRERLVGVLAARHRERLMRACWLALRLAASHHKLVGERHAWRDLMQELHAEHQFQHAMAKAISPPQHASPTSSASDAGTPNAPAASTPNAPAAGDPLDDSRAPAQQPTLAAPTSAAAAVAPPPQLERHSLSTPRVASVTASREERPHERQSSSLPPRPTPPPTTRPVIVDVDGDVEVSTQPPELRSAAPSGSTSDATSTGSGGRSPKSRESRASRILNRLRI